MYRKPQKTMFQNLVIVLVAALLIIGADAESHTIRFSNFCGTGTPILQENGVVVSTGAAYITNGPLTAIAYLDVGSCGSNGEGCTVVESTLNNAEGSSTTINMTSFSVPTGFGYYNGCDGEGGDCTRAGCPGATGIISPFPIECNDENVDLAITFCD
ncbi:hypothetical protein FB446DRAFT_755086 [Lentinula raphanica]|nr:hypothetical protein FB446DRAFT_755086 [Lentinula raphanica]